MARVPVRDLSRIRHALLTHSSRHRRLLLPRNNLSSTSFSSTSLTCYHPSIELLQSCQTTRHLIQVQAQLTVCGVFHFWDARLLKHASDSGDAHYAALIFRRIDRPGTFCVNNMIKAYSFSSTADQAVGFYFDVLKNGFSPNSYTFVWLVGCCAKMSCLESGQKCHVQALKRGVDLVLPVQNSLIHMYGSCGATGFARKMFDAMSQRDLVSWNSIVDEFVRAGDVGGAHRLFDVMPERNVVSWNIMINGYLKANNPGCAMLLFRRMARSGMRGNDTTMSCVLSACGRSARLKEGCSIHGHLVRTFSNNLNVILNTSLIVMYSKCKKAATARRVFDKMVRRNLVCWNAMIAGHCIHGNPEDGLNLFREMVDSEGSGTKAAELPDGVTYLGVLCACIRAGLLTKGRSFFSQMITKFKIKPNFAHYWCMANLHASAGLIQEAGDILRKIPEDTEDFSSEFILWANLLGSSRFQASATLGERIAKSLIELEPENFSHYRLLLNVYSAAGQWEDVARVKTIVKERRIGRMPGCNLLDLKEIVHGYRTGNLGQEVMSEIELVTREAVERPG